MESNFIKERVVVREEIIKKNLENAGDSRSKIKSALESPSRPSSRAIVLEEIVNDRLRGELVNISKQVDSICETIADYIKIKSAIKVFKISPNDIRVLTNVGCNFYAQCIIEDASNIFLCVGKDYYLHMTIDEASKMIDFKEAQLTKQLDSLQERASSIKAYIKVALDAIGKIYDMDRETITGLST